MREVDDSSTDEIWVGESIFSDENIVKITRHLFSTVHRCWVNSLILMQYLISKTENSLLITFVFLDIVVKN